MSICDLATPIPAAGPARGRPNHRRENQAARALAALVEFSEDAILGRTLDGTITRWNHAAQGLFGWSAAEVVGRPVSLLVPPGRTDEMPGIRSRLLRGERVASLETVRVRKDGSRVEVALTVSPVRDEAGRVVAAWVIARDITGRREAEEALRLRDRAIRAVPQGIVITDACRPGNPIVYASPGFERMTGYTQAEALGKSPRFLQGPQTDPAAVAQLREAVRGGRPCSVEILNYRKDGTPFWNAVSVAPVRDDGGRITHWVGVKTDVTERLRLEEQLRQAQKMEAIGRLAGGVAHDFNNLLTVINGYSELILRGLRPDDPTRGLLDEIKKAGERSASLTRQLLAFSRKQVVQARVLDLNAVVADTEKMLRRVIGEDVRLETALDAGLGCVRADPGQVEQVLLNLAVNARDAMPHGGRLAIRTRNAGPGAEGRHAVLEVADTGCGMTEEVKARIFEPFFTTKGPGRGTGLGLATVYGIVEQAGGRIAVESLPGRGTTFRIAWPCVEQPTRPGPATPDRQLPPQGRETVLLVEDEDGVRALTRHVLTGCGYTVLEATGGDEALRVAGAHPGPVQLLVSDVVMPGLGGRELADRLLARHPDMKVLFLSGYTHEAMERRGILEGQVNFLQKPFSTGALAHKVREVLDAPGADAGGGPGPVRP
jgi:two-component system cell cycle sensor histidine kinase/response regulator CckA